MDMQKITQMEKAGKILGDVLSEVMDFIKPGVTELEIDALADKLIAQKGGFPGFKKVPGYHHATCISTNDVVVHGIPTDRVVEEGDIVGVDCGVWLNGYHTDMAETRRVSTVNESNKLTVDEEKIDKFLNTGKKALFAGIKQAMPGNHVGDISKAIQDIVEGSGYKVVHSLVGHGVGRELHESPEIPGYLEKTIEKTPLLKPGMTIAIEVIYNMGSAEVVYTEGDDWTIVTEDGEVSGLFERTVLITEKGPKIITRYASDKNTV